MDIPLIGVLAKHGSQKVRSPYVLSVKSHLTQTMAPDAQHSHLAYFIKFHLTNQIFVPEHKFYKYIYSFVILPINIQQIHLFNNKKSVHSKPRSRISQSSTASKPLAAHVTLNTREKLLNWNTFLKLFTLVTKKLNSTKKLIINKHQSSELVHISLSIDK